MKLQKLILVVAGIGAMATGCSQKTPTPTPASESETESTITETTETEPASEESFEESETESETESEYTGPDRYHSMPTISQEQAVNYVMEFQSQLTSKLLMATLTYNSRMVDETMDEERHFSADYSGHLDQSPYGPGFTFEYVDGSFNYYDHSEELGEYYAENYQYDIGDGFVKILDTAPSRAAPTFTYTYYYDNTYLCVFGEGSMAGYDDVFYQGFKVDKNGITLEYFRISDYAEESSSYNEEFSVTYYEEE